MPDITASSPCRSCCVTYVFFWHCPAQDPVKPAVLRNRGNEYLHYEDDWYILGFKPDKYALIYYKGNNDAWQGYGGATVYTKCAPGWLLPSNISLLHITRATTTRGRAAAVPPCTPSAPGGVACQ